MKLKQHDSFKNFYLPEEKLKFFVFSADTSSPFFDFEKAFSGNTFHFLLIFYKDDTLVITASLNQTLSNALKARAIIWIDKLPSPEMNRVPNINFSNPDQVQAFSNIVFGKDTDGHRLILSNNGKSTVKFNLTNSTLEFTVNDGKKYKMFSGIGHQNEFDKYLIPLRHQDNLFGHTSKANTNNTGCLCFPLLPNPINPLQPKTALLSSDGSSNSLHSFQYFQEESYAQHVDAVALIHPYLPENFKNASAGFDSHLELFMKEDARTNLVDEFANRFTVPKNTSLVTRLAFVNPIESNTNLRNFFFMPKGGQSIDISAPGSFILMGLSGTERMDKTKLEFVEMEEVLFSEQQDGTVKNQKFSESLTSVLGTHSNGNTLQGVSYYIDSEKKSLFNNDQQAHLDDPKDRFEVSYTAIKVGSVAANGKAPFIPTLFFRKDPRLIELERLLSKNRIAKNVSQDDDHHFLDNANFLTPQGFFRNEKTLSFISPGESIDKKGDKISLQFDVQNVSMTSDFNLSISREDVFFVLRPSLIADKPEKMNVVFQIRDFTIDLAEFNTRKNEKNDTYIIFKFSRDSFAELLDNPSKWSNFGQYKPPANETQAMVTEIKKLTDFPHGDPNYSYFNDIIKTDKNWNGVVILNIPIGKSENLPSIFSGLTASQSLDQHKDEATSDDQRKFQTGLKFSYVAFTLNKTQITNGAIAAASTSFYGIIDYDLLKKPDGSPSPDYPRVSKYFPEKKEDIRTHRFLLTKLLVLFENSSIKNFKSFAFLQVPDIFETKVEFGNFPLTHDSGSGDLKANFIRLDGHYQKNSANNDEFNFSAQSSIRINFEKSVLKALTVSRLGFSYSEGTAEFRFDIAAGADLESWSKIDLISIEKLDFENIGFKFNLNGVKLPHIKFDLSKLLVFPKINFNGKGFLSSFPIRFSHFQTYRFKKIKSGSKDDFDFPDGDFDFFKFPHFDLPDIDFDVFGNLFSFVFDFDLGTLGNLSALKALKGKLVFGWSFNAGFLMGFKLDGPSSDGLHLNLFGALKIDISEVDYGKFKPPGATACHAFFLRLNDARLTIFGKQLPDQERVFNGIIIVDFSKTEKKIAWLINYDDQESGKLILGAGQHMGPPIDASVTSTTVAIDKTKATFQHKLKDIDGCNDTDFFNKINFRSERNWLIASEAILPDDWPIELKFIFNEPVLYGIYLGFKSDFLKGFSIDVLYKKLADNLGVYSSEIQLPDSIRSYELGGAFIRLPNIGIEIYTNGDWKFDVGFPRTSNDWSRSGFIQLRTAPPFVGFFGAYGMMSKVASLTLFKGYIDDGYSKEHLHIIQAGFALRVGIGFYFDKGILFVGASITVYAILEGAFAFEKKNGLSQLFPDHFALLGRFGALAELVGYVDFAIIKASVYISLRAEFGLLLVYLSREVPGVNSGKGIQPVVMYIEGEVRVEVSIKIGCVKIHLGFSARLRFEYTIGGSTSRHNLTSFTGMELPSNFAPLSVTPIAVKISGIREIPVVYLPAFSKINEGQGEQLVILHTFMIPFFGKATDPATGKIVFSKNNIFKDKIIKPFFSDLITELKKEGIEKADHYETLRSVLLNGYCDRVTAGQRERVKIHLSVDGYLPTFIHGINSAEKTAVDTMIQKYFLFIKDELKSPASNNSIIKAYWDEMMVIPAPIAGKIQIMAPDGTSLHQSQNSFNLKVDNLVNNVAGTPLIETTIGAITDYDDATLAWMETFYDEYKTQFINRKQQQNAFSLTNKDLREEVMIPEFFKLAALLVLEAFYSATNPKEKNPSSESFNPAISISSDGHFIYDGGDWDPNEATQQVIGQLNYFYNSGLRLPTKPEDTATFAIYEILKQRQPIQVKPDASQNLSDIHIFVDNQDITSDVFAYDTAKTDMLQFIGQFESNFSLDELSKEFAQNPIQFTRPFDLIPVTLALQNSKLGQGDSFRFFDLPTKLAQQGTLKSRYSFELNYASYKQQVDGRDVVEHATNKPGVSLLSIVRCLNVEIKVRKLADNVMEIISVFSKDLNLMNSLFNDDYAIGAIDVFYKPEQDKGKTESIQIERIIDNFTTIVKTNLSPRTSPPLFETDAVAFADNIVSKDREYWDDSNNTDKSNFLRLLWEALTTNNGGYYLVPDKKIKFPNDASGKELINGTLIFSFSGDQSKIPSYFNSIKLLGDKPLFEGLDNQSHYLYIDSITLSDATVTGKVVLEYHPLIPVHTMGFEIERNRAANPLSNYQNYLPLEFMIANDGGTPLLPADKVLPLMPLSENETNLRYNHITPVVTQDSQKDQRGKNLERYSAVGKKYQIGINVRDVFGARTSRPDTFIAKANYEHFYFDKLVPLEAWPLIKFSYWINSVGNHLVAEISCTCDIREVLDMAGIKREGDKYRYELGKEINKSNPDDPQTDIDRLQQLVPGLLNNLYTILAQLTDQKTSAIINGQENNEQKEKWRLKVQDLASKLEMMITPDDKGKYFMPSKPVMDTARFSIAIDTSGPVKNKLVVEVGLNRNGHFIHQAGDTTFKKSANAPSLDELTAGYIWDYSATLSSFSKLKPLNPSDPERSKLKDLNNYLRSKTSNRLCLGIATEGVSDVHTRQKLNEQILYVIDSDAISNIRVKEANANKEINQKCYFGIEPVSNTLWSGDYKPSIDKPKESFSNIDLDKSLRVVLEKIDQLLQSKKLSKEIDNTATTASSIKPVFNKLVAAKKMMVNEKLQNKLSWVMEKAEAGTGMTKEFRDLLLSGLTNFYAYDGVIKTTVSGTELLGELRLTLNVDVSNPATAESNYNVVCSKIDSANKEWYILFDQKESVKDRINFELRPKITHIEFDIRQNAQSEIEQSTWIQLVDPEQLKDDKYAVKNWPKITREFPDKPVITRHACEQLLLDDGKQMPTWDIGKAGLWNYILSVKDTYFTDDIIHVDLYMETSGLVASGLTEELGNFEGFIAYWASKILTLNENFDALWKDFVNDLFNLFSSQSLTSNASSFVGNHISFELIKKGEEWAIENISNPLLKIDFPRDASGHPVKTEPSIVAGPFNIFDKTNRVICVLPKLKVYRNREVKNSSFIYETETVEAATPATPHIKFFFPVALKKGDSFSSNVFGTKSQRLIPDELAFKATAKYLIDVAGKNAAGNERFPSEQRSLPIIPVQQIECAKKGLPSKTDELFDHFDKANGYQSFSVTVYSDTMSKEDLPVFYIDNLYKLKP
jgi:hypothetical protein